MGDTFGDSSGYTDYGGGDYVDYGNQDYGGDSLAIDYGAPPAGGYDFSNIDLPSLSPIPDLPLIPTDISSVTPNMTGDLGDGGTFFSDPSLFPSAPGGVDSNLFNNYFDYYLSQGWTVDEAGNQAAIDAAQGSFQSSTSEPGYADYQQSWPLDLQPMQPAPLPPQLPISIPVNTTQTPQTPSLWLGVDYGQAPLPPSLPMTQAPLPSAGQLPTLPPLPIVSGGAAPKAPGLPGYCPAGTYHPVSNPQACVPFPPAPSGGSGSSQQQQQQQQQQCPPGQYKSPSTGTCKPVPKCPSGYVFDPRAEKCVPYGQTPQALCPTGYWPNYQTRRCDLIPACTTPGTVFDMTRGICVPASQLANQQPSELDSLFGDLANVPWWLWLLLGGALLLNSKDNEGKVTTVKYRRAR
jgi:type II secretory pathway pseudopilin PulG